eukprot:6486240-Amphidinium_carterae.1
MLLWPSLWFCLQGCTFVSTAVLENIQIVFAGFANQAVGTSMDTCRGCRFVNHELVQLLYPNKSGAVPASEVARVAGTAEG